MLPKNYQDLKMNRGSNNTTSTLFATNNIAYTHIFLFFFLGGGIVALHLIIIWLCTTDLSVAVKHFSITVLNLVQCTQDMIGQ